MAKVLAGKRSLVHIPRIHVNVGWVHRSTVVQPRKTDTGNTWEQLHMSGLNYETVPQENEVEEKLRRIPHIGIRPLLACTHTHKHIHMYPLVVCPNMKRTRKKNMGNIDICILKYRQRQADFYTTISS